MGVKRSLESNTVTR